MPEHLHRRRQRHRVLLHHERDDLRSDLGVGPAVDQEQATSPADVARARTTSRPRTSRRSTSTAITTSRCTACPSPTRGRDRHHPDHVRALVQHVRVVLQDLGEPRPRRQRESCRTGARLQSHHGHRPRVRGRPHLVSVRAGASARPNVAGRLLQRPGRAVLRARRRAHRRHRTDPDRAHHCREPRRRDRVPPGRHLSRELTPCTCRRGVELRGSYGARHTAETIDGTTLLAVEGQGTPTPEQRHGVHLVGGSRRRPRHQRPLPEPGLRLGGYPVVPFPYTFRSLGAEHLDVQHQRAQRVPDRRLRDRTDPTASS